MLNQEQIKEIIPHRDPFLLIDEILELEPGKRAVGMKHVRLEEDYFRGHFPGQPVMPGVLILESLAQVGAVAVLCLPENKGKIAFFGGVKEAKFRGMVQPGDDLRLEAELIKLRSRAGVGSGKAYVGDKLVCECEFMFMFGQDK